MTTFLSHRCGLANFIKNLIAFTMAAFSLACPNVLLADDERSVEPAQSQEELRGFLHDSTFSATLYYFQRYRDRLDVNRGDYGINLSHASGQLSLDFESGYAEDIIGVDFGIFGSMDFYNDGSVDHEMNFFPWRNPWQPDWTQTKTKDAASVYKALIKVKAGPAWARAGYFQPKGPGVLGVNWSFLPGTYQGAEVGADFGPLSLAAAWANQYKAPWFTRTYKFKKTDYSKSSDDPQRLRDVDYLWSAGARYEITDGLNVELAYGESQDFLWNAHLKAKYNKPLGDNQNIYLTWQTYLMNDQNGGHSIDDNFASTAWQQYLAAAYDTGPWTFNLEFTYTKAPNDSPEHVGYFAYRLTRPSGGSKGAYEPWWDLRSDWNHHEEKAVFLKAGRKLDDLGLAGVKAAVSGAYGWGGKSWETSQKFKEAAYGIDLSYTVDQGLLEGAVFALHFTRYDNKTTFNSWDPFKNAFQDEHDIKFSLVIPLTK